MSDSLFNNVYNPDVLSCLANLSNDEVFTPPEVVNKMLDMLPEELFQNPDTKFLDPACKTGVFLREIAKRLIKGLEPQIPDLQERIDHIFKKQLYGIAITEMTSLLSRRGVYCSKYPNSTFSVTQFDSAEGNIRFKRLNHTWRDGKCSYCGASQSEYDRDDALETHAYEWIHVKKPEEIIKVKFDVIIGNPPYQLSDGGNGASAKPIYHLFVEQAKKLKPRYLSMIIPARWYAGGKGLDNFRTSMLNDNSLRIIHDFVDASDCFSGVEIKGGVCYFLWNKDDKGLCEIIRHEDGEIVSKATRKLLEKNSELFIRYSESIPILHKVQAQTNTYFSDIVSSRKPFGLATNFEGFQSQGKIKIYANKKNGFLRDEQHVPQNRAWINKWKLFIPKAIGSGNMREDWIKPIVGEPNSICTETYIVVGPFDDKTTVNNVLSYTQTKFFHFMMGMAKITQDATSKVYQFVPMQDFSKTWTDKELYAKYNLTQEEVDFIESMIRPME